MVLAAAGCDEETVRQGIPIEQMPGTLAVAMCEKAYLCCPAGTFAADPDWGPDQTACTAKLTAQLAMDVPAFRDSIVQHRLAYHGDRLEDCVSLVRSAACARAVSVLEAEAACYGYLEPRVGVGGACSLREECIASRCTGDHSEGVCEKEPGPGDDCSLASCSRTLYCDDGNVCQKKKPNGAECASEIECESRRCTARACEPRSGPDICAGGQR